MMMMMMKCRQRVMATEVLCVVAGTGRPSSVVVIIHKTRLSNTSFIAASLRT